MLLVGHEPANPPTSLPDGIVAFDYAPFSVLFPRAAAIVHQGGVGTTGQAMRSGRPMLVMPYAHDQAGNASECGDWASLEPSLETDTTPIEPYMS